MFNSLLILLNFFILIIFQILLINIQNIKSENVSLATINVTHKNNVTKEFISSNFEPKIVNGRPATLNGNEHMVSIRVKYVDSTEFGSGHFCGGSLISTKVVLTAAHCLLIPNTSTKWTPYSLIAVMGILQRRNSKGAQTREVNRVIIHKGFDPNTFQNDIGLLILKIPFDLSLNVKVINYSQISNYSTGQVAHLAGWGATVQRGNTSLILMTTDVKIVNKSECKRAYQNINYITEPMFCAADLNKDSCQGDSGGPLVINNIQYGVVSWGKGCGIPGYPGVYTDVAFYKNWIITNLGNKIILENATFLFIFISYFFSYF